ncbi:sensor histidine kinase [Chengkuizengella axinellae]|uniref:histidine kinase n=1 Tax=Chengkuizengella axinellae TaxID=3064388 RepID=A0ABT9IW28_9BACL|nr:sensor histidine kinase [Chengkuizengella sp. 2205SS18-9]MDP5273302.1 sensor histidine kinase [Chengkuizengella sp. 2205SS18-9]
MKDQLSWFQYPFITVAAIATIFINKQIDTPVFTLFILLLILLKQVQNRWISKKLLPLFVLIETVYMYWLNVKFYGILPILFLSSLFTIFRLESKKARLFFIFMQYVFLNTLLFQQPPELLLAANLAYVMIVILLWNIYSLTYKQKDMTHLYDQLRGKHYEIENARKRIKEYAVEVENMAQIEERNRISKEIHDELGHKLIRAKMMMEAALPLVKDQPQKSIILLEQIRDQLSDNMETLRKTVRNMKPDDTKIHQYSINHLIEQFEKNSNMKIQYEMNGLPYPLYPSAELTLYRNAQEALTNAVRHAEATQVNIYLQYHPSRIEFTIFNNGKLPNNNIKRGLGLKGMEERIELLGGEMVVEVTDLFMVKTKLPRKLIEVQHFNERSES